MDEGLVKNRPFRFKEQPEHHAPNVGRDEADEHLSITS